MSQFTEHVAGRPVAEGGCGDPSPYTAHGVEVAIRASLGGDSLAGRHVVVVGLGHVGGDARAPAARGRGRADRRRRRLRQAPAREAAGCRWVSPEEALRSRPTCSRRARSVACSTGGSSRGCAFRSSPAPPTISSRTKRSPDQLAERGDRVGARLRRQRRRADRRRRRAARLRPGCTSSARSPGSATP